MAKDQIAGRLVIVGGSAGSLDVVLNMIGALPMDADFAMVIVLHRKSSYDSSLADLLADRTQWTTKEVEEKDSILAQHIYLAPGDYHLLLENDHSFSLDVSEKVNFSRPSIDISFESAADIYGDKLTAILLSGANADGVEGLKKVREKGGLCVVQDPTSAEVPFMPQRAVDEGAFDHLVGGNQLGEFLRGIRN